MNKKIEAGTLGLLLLFLLAAAGGFFAGRATKPATENTFVTEYITQNQTQEQWQAQVNITAVGGTNFRSVSVSIRDRTNITLLVATNFTTNGGHDAVTGQ